MCRPILLVSKPFFSPYYVSELKKPTHKNIVYKQVIKLDLYSIILTGAQNFNATQVETCRAYPHSLSVCLSVCRPMCVWSVCVSHKPHSNNINFDMNCQIPNKKYRSNEYPRHKSLSIRVTAVGRGQIFLLTNDLRSILMRCILIGIPLNLKCYKLGWSLVVVLDLDMFSSLYVH